MALPPIPPPKKSRAWIIEDWRKEIDAFLKLNHPNGYRFAIFDENGPSKSGAGGFSRTAKNPPKLVASADDRMDIASMAKTITGAAVLNALQRKGLTPDIPIAPFLPPDWKMHAKLKTKTFRDYLTHRTGVQFGDGQADDWTFEGIKALTEAEPNGTIEYENYNFAIMRIALPLLETYDRYTKKVTFPGFAKATAQWCAQRYIEIVNLRVLEPSGVPSAGCNSYVLQASITQPKVQMLSYPFNDPNAAGLGLEDWTLNGGANGWCLSVNDMAKVLHTLAYTEAILSDRMKKYMFEDGMGADIEPMLLGSRVFKHGAVINMGGGQPGDALFCGGWYMYRDLDLIFVFLSNTGYNPKEPIWDTKLQQALVKAYKP